MATLRSTVSKREGQNFSPLHRLVRTSAFTQRPLKLRIFGPGEIHDEDDNEINNNKNNNINLFTAVHNVKKKTTVYWDQDAMQSGINLLHYVVSHLKRWHSSRSPPRSTSNLVYCRCSILLILRITIVTSFQHFIVKSCQPSIPPFATASSMYSDCYSNFSICKEQFHALNGLPRTLLGRQHSIYINKQTQRTQLSLCSR